MDKTFSAYRPALAAALLALALSGGALPASAQDAAPEAPSDSLAFAMKKRKLLEGALDVRLAAIVEAADDLARDGFFAEALELIYDLEDSSWSANAENALEAELRAVPGGQAGGPAGGPAAGDGAGGRKDGAPEDNAFLAADSLPLPSDSAGRHGWAAGPGATDTARPGVPAMPGGLAAGPRPASPFQQLQSYVRSSLEYDDWDGTPVGGEVRAKLDWLPEGSFLERVTPTFAGSDRRTFFGLSARGSAFGRQLKISAEGLAEKKMWQSYGDSLDRISAQAVAEAGTRPLGKAVSVSVPVRVELEEFRHDRLGLLSRRSLGAAPALEAVSDDWRKTLMVAWEARVYRFPTSRSSDFLRHGPYLLANWFGDFLTAEAEAQVMDDRYRRDTSMYTSRAWEARASAFAKILPRFKAGLRLQHNGEYSRYADTLRTISAAVVDSITEYRMDSLLGRYHLQGRVTTVQPALTLEWAAIYSATLSLAYSRGWYPLLAAYGGRDLFPVLFIDESFTAWKPEATFSVLSRKLFLNASASYELHKPSVSPHYYTRYHEVVGLGGNLSWKLGRNLEVDFSGLFRAQTKGAASAAMDMTSVAAGITSRFQ